MIDYVTKPRKIGRTAALKAIEQCRCGEHPPGWGTDTCPCIGCWAGEDTISGVGCCDKRRRPRPEDRGHAARPD